MGAKSKIEQAIRRAKREGRAEDVTDLENELAELKKQRGDRAFARRVYTVQPGDSYFSIAGQELGDEQWVQALIDANPGIIHLYPGMEIVLPRSDGLAPSISASDFTEINTAYEWGAAGEVANVDTPDAEQDASATNETGLSEPAQPEEPMTAEEEDALVEQAAIELEQLAAPEATETPSGFDGRKAMAALAQQTPPPPTVTPNGAISPEAGTGSRRSDEPYPQNRRGGVLPTPQIEAETSELTETPTAHRDVNEATIDALTTVIRQGMPEGSPQIALDETVLERNLSLIVRTAAEFGLNVDELAYVLATAHWESRMGQWMYELYDGDPYEYFSHKYYYRDENFAWESLGNASPEDGYNFRGRGFVQLTGRTNYQKYTDHFFQNMLFLQEGQPADLITYPDLVAENPTMAAYILVHGMVMGSFTTSKLSDYVQPNGDIDFYSARAIINPADLVSYGQIAAMAAAYLSALNDACLAGELPSGIECKNR